MKPISGETVLSIIHGPATTGHIKEMSMFLRRPIDVWAKDRLMLFGRCHHRQPRLSLAFDSPRNHQGGHFTLLDGSEPRNPDAGSHPLNCAFDVVSDQTGYPASALRQVAVLRMLVKLYQSRLRGHDYHVQCPTCGISGGRVWTQEEAKRLIDSSPNYGGHAHVHVERPDCTFRCTCPNREEWLTNPDMSTIRCMERFLEIFPLPCHERWRNRTLFQNDQDLQDILLEILNSEDGTRAYQCLFLQVESSCTALRIGTNWTRAEVVCDVTPLRKTGLEYGYNPLRRFRRIGHFDIVQAKAVFKVYLMACSRTSQRRVPNEQVIRLFYLLSLFPVRPLYEEDIIRDRVDWVFQLE